MSTELFQSKLTLLNKNFLQFVTKKVEQYPSADLSPTLKSYLKHLADLDKLYSGPEEEKKLTDRPFKKALPPSAKLKRFGELKPSESNSTSTFSSTLISKPVEPLKSISTSKEVSAPVFSSTLPTSANSNPLPFVQQPSAGLAVKPSEPLPVVPSSAPCSSSEPKKSETSNAQLFQRTPASSYFGSQSSQPVFKESAPAVPSIPKAPSSNSFTPYSTEQRLSRKRQAKTQLSYDDYLKPLGDSPEKKERESTFKPPPSFDPYIFKKKDDALVPSPPVARDLFDKKNETTVSKLTNFNSDFEPKKKDEAPSCPVFPSFGIPKSSSSPSEPTEDPKPSDPTPPKFNLFGSSSTEKKELPTFNFLSRSEDKKDESKGTPGVSIPTKNEEKEKLPNFSDLFRTDENKPKGTEPSLSLFLKKPEGEAAPFTLFSDKSSSLNVSSTENTGEDEEEGKEEPPKVEAVDQSEPDALFSAKATVHLLKEGTNSWNKLGVGYVNIKDLGEKKQLLVRAATTLGTIWVNTAVNNHVKSFKMNEKRIKVRFPNEVVDEKTKEKSVKISTYLLTVAAPDCDKLSDYLNAAPM
ncbi:unnamed protein product [Bursaphelenchus xylophilus]|uniref:(pine wood nematode) hypothetical protein n=1 Tax=Bursaphelenchus xylophilus TaxID=6326 RepID=A0A1I7RL69_BURXY|nr:unnamed protein product [Bursaphelenchus xylophilus]CAG9083372.1 unnamed protein product [Bursaphelenchus xylophilus]